MTRAALLLAALAACTGANPEQALPPAGDTLAAYGAAVQPILEARCGTLDCHGDPGRPLRLYAETGLRARDDLRGRPITADELAANARALAAVDPGAAPAASLLLLKPLNQVAHVGGAVWGAPGEPQPACFLGWLAGASADPQVAAACARADAEVALPPP